MLCLLALVVWFTLLCLLDLLCFALVCFDLLATFAQLALLCLLNLLCFITICET